MTEDIYFTSDPIIETPVTKCDNYKWKIRWGYVTFFTIAHILCIYSVYSVFFEAMWKTILWAAVLYFCSLIGVMSGAHRLWSHKSYKVRLPLKVILLVFLSHAFQNSAFKWARDHRMHHKYSDTDADPYNSSRGFFFSHIGWLLARRHPEFKARLKTIDLSDLWADPWVRFQHRYFIYTVIIVNTITTCIPMLWNEDFWTSFFVSFLLRYILSIHATFLINSAAHMWGYRPYDKNIKPTQMNFVSAVTFGEGFHNYHHTFPWDYKAAEFGSISLNSARFFIEVMSWLGLAYDLKTASDSIVKMRIKRTGDGTYDRSRTLKNLEDITYISYPTVEFPGHKVPVERSVGHK